MVSKKILYFLLYFSYNSINSLRAENVSGSKLDSSATDKLKAVYSKYNYTYEKTNRNDNPLIYQLNKDFRINIQSAYCGSSLYYFITKAGFKIELPKTKAPLARNWGLYGETIWSQYNGWKVGINDRKPKDDELFIILFQWNGRFHVGAVGEIEGFNFITMEGNTSDVKVRKKEFLYFNNITAKRKDIYIPYLKRQGIFAAKERYNVKGVYKIIRYKIL